MNTPAHAIVNLLLLSCQPAHKPTTKPTHKRSAIIIAGALLPDLIIIIFYAWQLLLGTPNHRSGQSNTTGHYGRP